MKLLPLCVIWCLGPIRFLRESRCSKGIDFSTCRAVSPSFKMIFVDGNINTRFVTDFSTYLIRSREIVLERSHFTIRLSVRYRVSQAVIISYVVFFVVYGVLVVKTRRLQLFFRGFAGPLPRKVQFTSPPSPTYKSVSTSMRAVGNNLYGPLWWFNGPRQWSMDTSHLLCILINYSIRCCIFDRQEIFDSKDVTHESEEQDRLSSHSSTNEMAKEINGYIQKITDRSH